MPSIQKTKILNDPIYGFIKIPHGLIFDIVSLPCFQRLRRIRQLGLTNLVYPGASHNRLQHAFGAMHLMQEAIDVIKTKGTEITKDEEEGALISILLHDIGHGPFSHSLEYNIIDSLTHEKLSLLFMEQINAKFNGRLNIAIEIFKNTYKKKFLHQLVSGQLDTDRLDYLNRDSFFTGVTEGVIGSERIIKMFDVVNDELVVEEKGIYSVEKFLIARRLMYWQVYLHKTVISAERLLINILKRAKELSKNNEQLFATPHFSFFLKTEITQEYLEKNLDLVIKNFALLDDDDLITSIKVWQTHSDKILSTLSQMLINRKLFRTKLQKYDFDDKEIKEIKTQTKQKFNATDQELNYLVYKGSIRNKTYSYDNENIKILTKTGEINDITKISDMLNMSFLSKEDKKYYLCFPK